MFGLRALVASVAVVFVATAAQAQVTNFSRDVATAIDRGLDWLDAQAVYQNPSTAQDAAGLAALALLEKRRGVDPNAAPAGYANAQPADQARLDRVMAFIFHHAVEGAYYGYRDGVDLMAISVYLRTGGVEQVQARGILNLLVDRVLANQNGAGYWCYRDGSCNDSSVTQFTTAGLGAALSVYRLPAWRDAVRMARIEAALGRGALAYVQHAERQGLLDPGELGHGYHPGLAPSLQQTSTGLWVQLQGGSDVNAPGVQSFLRWLQIRYEYRGDTELLTWGGFDQSYFYYLFAASRAFRFIESAGVATAAGNLDPSALGVLGPNAAPAFHDRDVHLVPAAQARVAGFGAGGVGYYADPNEGARWYFDFAYTLLSMQQAGGLFDPPQGLLAWNQFACQSYAILVLQRSTGGFCEENACGECGPAPVEVCNGEDDDCDGSTDEGVVNSCGECAPQEVEVCNGADDDCDGLTDEGQLNDCGGCGALPAEVCNDEDDDCDGSTDEGVRNVCGECGPDPVEVCNGEDDDCDGSVDEGLLNACGECGPTPNEICNGMDDDCDGAIDEGTLNACGGCGPVPVEICDGVDNDCDGAIDEGLINACGQCGPLPAEVCDGIDNDCDGGVDEGLLNDCGACGPTPVEVCNGTDDDCDGVVDDGLLNACGECGPTPVEVCDGIDNNCNGLIDEDTLNA